MIPYIFYGVYDGASEFKIATGIGASQVGSKSNVSFTKSAQSVGASEAGINSSVTFSKTSRSVGASRSGVVSRPLSGLYVQIFEKKINRLRGPEWITVSQGFWNS